MKKKIKFAGVLRSRRVSKHGKSADRIPLNNRVCFFARILEVGVEKEKIKSGGRSMSRQASALKLELWSKNDLAL